MAKHSEKSALRTHFRHIRLSVTDREEKALRLKERFLRAGLHEGVKTIAVFSSMPEEIDLAPLIEALRAQGIRIVYPYTTYDNTLGFRIASETELVPHPRYPLKEPKEGLPEAEPDLILVPLVAFDAAGRRLGMGAGYYDRTIAFLRAKGRMVPCIGIAFEAQKSDSALPHDAHDMMLDAVVTESGCHDLRK